MTPPTEKRLPQQSQPQTGRIALADDAIDVARDIAAFRLSVENLRKAGLDDTAISAIAEFHRIQ